MFELEGIFASIIVIVCYSLYSIVQDGLSSIFTLIALIVGLQAVVQLVCRVVYRKKEARGKTVLITGGGSGIGKEMAKRFAKLGSTVIIWDINGELLDSVGQQIEFLVFILIES